MNFIKVYISLILLSLLVSCATTTSQAPGLSNTSNTEIGKRYLLGLGVQEDDQTAFKYFKQAADQNDAFAQNEVAYLYASGKGVTQDYSQAFAYYQKAADANLASAQYNLGLFYLNGLGVEANPELAKEWLQKAAQADFEPAIVKLKAMRT